jgi:glucan phosphoethanolaminetransferase (alkaline phosphatase superfamily)
VDLKSFMVVLIISVFTVSTTFTMLTNNPNEDDFSDEIDFCNYLYVVYEYVFQQFPTAYSP